MPSGLYSSAMSDALRGNIDYDTDTFFCVLLTDAYVQNLDTHTRRSQLTNEVVGTGYTAGGVSVTVSVAAYNPTNDWVDITLGGFSLANSTITARYAAYYKRRGGVAANEELIGLVDFGTNIVSSNGNFVLSASTLRAMVN